MSERIKVAAVTKRFTRRSDRPTSIKQLLRRPHLGRSESIVALDEVSLDVGAEEIVGVVGHNGSGKSTLLKCIAGILTPTSGSIRIAGRAAALLELGAGFHPELSGRDNVYLNGSILGLSRREIDHRFDDIVGFAGLEDAIDEPVKHYSSGMYVRLGFAIAAWADADVLLVDEVLAVGDPAFQRRCLDRVQDFKREGGAVLFVSHDTNLVHRVCDRVAVLDHGQLITVDEPGPALEELRSRLFDLDRQPGTTTDDEPMPRIASVELGRVPSQDRHSSAVRPGEALTVHADIVLPPGIDDLTIGIEIRDTFGSVVFGTNTDIVHADVRGAVAAAKNRQEPAIRTTFDLRSVALTAGTYSVTVGVHNADSTRVYDWRDHACWFDVVDEADHSGASHLDPEVSARPLDP